MDRVGTELDKVFPVGYIVLSDQENIKRLPGEWELLSTRFVDDERSVYRRVK